MNESHQISTHMLSASSSLWQAFFRGVRDNLVAELLVQCLRVGGTIFLARALAPGDFGLLKILLIVAMVATLFSEAGIPDALIQREDLTPDHETTAWWLTLGFTGITLVVLYFGAAVIATAMGLRHLRLAIQLLCLPLMLEGSAIVSVARLSRSFRFGALALADVIAELAFLATAFVVLRQQRPEWSLPLGLAARFATHAVVIWAADRRIPFGIPRLAAARDLLRFAVTVLRGRIVTIASGNADFLLVGRLLGANALGYYSMAWDLLRFVPDRLHRVVGRVALPAFCRLRTNEDLGAAYCALMQHLSHLILPFALCLAVAAPELLTTIYGPKWLPATTPMRFLACGLALSGLRMANAPIYYARNYPSLDIFLNGARLILIAIAVIATAKIGLPAVSASVGFIEALISISGQFVVCALIGLTLNSLLTALTPSIRVTAFCLITISASAAIAKSLGLSAPAALILLTLPTGLTYFWLQGGEWLRLALNAFTQTPSRPLEVQAD